MAARCLRDTVIVPSGEITLVKSPPKYRVVPMITWDLTALEAPHVLSVGLAGGVAWAAGGRASGMARSATSARRRPRPLHRWNVTVAPSPVGHASVRVCVYEHIRRTARMGTERPKGVGRGGAEPRRAQPPATAGRMDTVSPSETGVSSDPRYRTSSSFRYTLM